MYLYGKDVASEGLVVDLGLCPEVRRVRIHSLAELCPLVELFEDWMRLQGYPRKDIFAVTLALVEVTTNAVLHGNRGDARKQVRIAYLMTPDEVLMEVEDEGEGFDPACVADPVAGENVGRAFGRGLFLTRAYTSWMTFNSRGNRVTLCRRRSAA